MMSEARQSLEMVVEVAAAPGELWKAVSTGEGIQSWFAPAARVVPGLGGSIWLSWGPGMEAEAALDVWEEGRAIGWTEKSGKRVEWHVQEAGAASRLRMLQVPGSAGEEKAWKTFFRSLQFSLERHLHEASTHVAAFRSMPVERATAIAALGRRMHLELDGLAVGAEYSAELAGLGAIAGERLEPELSGFYLLTLSGWKDSLLMVFVEGGGPDIGAASYVTLQWILFGEAQERASILREWLSTYMDELVKELEVAR